MAQWYAQLTFHGDLLLGDSVADFGEVEDVAPTGSSGQSKNGDVDRYTTVLVSGYALYGKIRGFYALGVAHVEVDQVSGKSYFSSEESRNHLETIESLSTVQRSAIRTWLMELDQSAWANSTEPFRRSLKL